MFSMGVHRVYQSSSDTCVQIDFLFRTFTLAVLGGFRYLVAVVGGRTKAGIGVGEQIKRVSVNPILDTLKGPPSATS